MNSIEMMACEGRQLDYDTFDLFESYRDRVKNTNTIEEFRQIAYDFGLDFAHAIGEEYIEIDARVASKLEEGN